MKQETDIPVRGIRIKKIAYACIFACLLLMGVIFLEIARVNHCYQRLTDITQECLEGLRCAVSLERSSDYLTNQVRLFVLKKDPENMKLYFEEIEGKNRENMVARLEAIYGSTDPKAVSRLEAALHQSQDLEQLEFHAMRLVSYAIGLPSEELPLSVSLWEMTAEEKRASKEELIKFARDLVYGTEYILEKQLIKAETQETLDLLNASMEARQTESEKALTSALIEQRVLIVLIAALICAIFWCVGALIVHPVSDHVRSIQSSQKWKVSGAFELRYLASIYNQLYDKNEAYQKDLEYKAEHDALTGICNRAAFEEKKDVLRNDALSVALILVDVDHFKEVNDTKGHEMGDLTLQKIAELLCGLALDNKYCIARIGGDEFAVILRNAKNELFPTIQKEFQRINLLLAAGYDGIPPISVSSGVAFSENGYTKELFRQADEALYSAKKQERGRCCMGTPA